MKKLLRQRELWRFRNAPPAGAANVVSLATSAGLGH
jgi:hypothetical protein